MSDYIQITCAAPDKNTAQSLAKTLLAEKAAACIQIIPIHSVYVWNGKPESNDEWLMLIKTSAGLYKTVEKLIRTNHPYEVPEIIATPITNGLNDYLSWIDENIAPKTLRKYNE